MAPTGAALSYTGTTFYERRGDLIAHIWVSTSLLEQLRKGSELAQGTASQADALH